MILNLVIVKNNMELFYSTY